ncbi:hypothetical protein PQX77_017550 [Marasmius sp. AFHP31]|nr:hypothetical protein PQX77_017550 [Marasmius sp. AFHP31]
MNAKGPIPIDLGILSMQAAGIAPTLIITRAISRKGLRTFNGDSTSASTGGMQFAPRSRVMNISTVDVYNSEVHDPERLDGGVLGAEKEEQVA